MNFGFLGAIFPPPPNDIKRSVCYGCRGSGKLRNMESFQGLAMKNPACWFCLGLGILPTEDLEGFLMAKCKSLFRTEESEPLKQSYKLYLFSSKFPGSQVRMKWKRINIQNSSPKSSKASNSLSHYLHSEATEFRDIDNCSILDYLSNIERAEQLNLSRAEASAGRKLSFRFGEFGRQILKDILGLREKFLETVHRGIFVDIFYGMKAAESEDGSRIKSNSRSVRSNPEVGMRRGRKVRKVRNIVREEAEKEAKFRALRKQRSLSAMDDNSYILEIKSKNIPSIDVDFPILDIRSYEEQIKNWQSLSAP